MAMAPDFVVEVRDINFARLGQIAPEYLDLKFIEVFRSVGSWELKLPAEHPLLPDLKTKGAGIVVTQRSTGRVYSGRTRSCVLSQNAEDPNGTWVITGDDDNVVAAATVVYPDPANEADAQTAAYWNANDDGETVMKSLVDVNIGASALPAREYPWLTTVATASLGATVSVSLRFDNLADALTSIGIKANLGWRFYQVGDGVEFDVYEPADKTDLIRLDVRNGGLESTELGWTAPAATEVLVLGQGEGVERTVLPVTSTESLAEAVAWGLRWESAKDQRNTDDPTELQQAGEEVLSEKGSTVNSLAVTPSDAPGQKLGEDWWLGDLVTVNIDGVPTVSTVTQVATSITAAGLIRQATVGDPVGFDWEAKIGSKVQQHEKRLGDLETLVGTGVSWEQVGDGFTGRGTTAQRNALFGTPATDAARVALANSKVTWFNTDLGWDESYYAVTGLSGLTALGLVAGTASGWYPISFGPRAFIVPSAQQSLTTGNLFNNMAAFGTGHSNRRGGAAFFTLSSGRITHVMAGYYRIRAHLAVQSGAGTGALYLTRNATASGANVLAQDALTLNASYGMMFKLFADEAYMAAGDTAEIYAASVGSAIFAPGATSAIRSAGYIFTEYIGPRLVNE